MTERKAPQTGEIIYKTFSFTPIHDGEGVTKSVDGAQVKVAIPTDAPSGLHYFIASTEEKDLDGDIILQDGLDWSGIQKGLPWMESHDYGKWPLGSIQYAKVVGGVSIIGVRWDDGDEHAKYVKGKYDRGFATACSIGFVPEEWAWMEDYSIKFIKGRVIETSACPIGANPGARDLGTKTANHAEKKTMDEAFLKAIEEAAQRGFEKGYEAKCAELDEQPQEPETDTTEEQPIEEPEATEPEGEPVVDDTPNEAEPVKTVKVIRLVRQ